MEGLDARDGGGLEPPDVQIAAGPGTVVEVVNVAARVWRTSGGVASTPQALPVAQLLGVPDAEPLTDPRIIYDAPSGRFFLTITDERTGAIVLGVTRTSDPTGAWSAYKLAPQGCPDQPRLGVDDSVVVIAADVFTGCSDEARPVGGQLWVANKQELLDGVAAPDIRVFGPDPRDDSLQPVRSLTSTSTEYVVSVDNPFASVVHLLAVQGVPPAATSLVRLTDLPITPLRAPLAAAQPETPTGIVTNDDRILDAVWSGDRLWATANDGCVPIGDSSERSCGRLLGIDTAARRLFADSQLGRVQGDVFFPALSLDAAGDVAIVYGTSARTAFASVDAIARLPDGSFTQPVTIASPGVLESGRRYGDYFGAATDPLDPSIVWVAGEVPKLAVPHGWGTAIGALTVNPGGGESTAPDTTPPSVTAIASSGRAGSLVRLGYRVFDDSGRTHESVVVYRRTRKLATLTTPIFAVDPNLIYFVQWRAPRSARGMLRFCVRATDAAGNTSRISCAALHIR